MASAGQQLVAGRIPGERIASNPETSASSTITTTETSVHSVTAALVSGRTYRVVFDFRYTASVSTDLFWIRVREGSGTGGTELQATRIVTGHTSSGAPARIEIEYEAASTGDQTFSLTLQRSGGTGNIARSSVGTHLAYVEYLEG